MIGAGPEEALRDALRNELRRRMSRPQRHRLLEGYPMGPLLRPVREGFDPFRGIELDRDRPLISTSAEVRPT